MSRKVLLKENDVAAAAAYLTAKLSELYLFEVMTVECQQSIQSYLQSIIKDMQCINGDPVWYLCYTLKFDEVNHNVTLSPVKLLGCDDYYAIIP